MKLHIHDSKLLGGGGGENRLCPRPSEPSTDIAQYDIYINDHNCIQYIGRETRKTRLVEAAVIRNQELSVM